jgi:hypothetical protein
LLLKKIADKIKNTDFIIQELPDNYIKNMLDTQDAIPEKTRSATYAGYVHVSSLSGNFCAREYAIAQHEDLQLFETLTGGHKVTFRIGRAVESHVRENIIKGHGKENIFAMWKCECQIDKPFPEEGTYRVGLWKPHIACKKCNKPLDVFDEPTIKDETNGVSGRPDLVVYHGKTLHITEVKSIKKEAWEELTEPLESHVKQNIFYPPLLRSLDLPVSNLVTFVYVTKDFKWGSPYKTFTIDITQGRYKALREELLAEAKQVKTFKETGESPPRICLTENSPLAKKCRVCFRCFNVYKDDIK